MNSNPRATVSVKISAETDFLLETLKLRAREDLFRGKSNKVKIFKDDLILFALKECMKESHLKAFAKFVMERR